MYLTQYGYDIRCEWGLAGIEHIGPGSDALVIVDVLSFTTCVDVAAARGAVVYPYKWMDESTQSFAESIGGVAATHRGSGGYTLSPASLRHIPEDMRLVLPSPNGSALSVAAARYGSAVFAACLRNAEAVARAALGVGPRISIIAGGERLPDGTLRPSVEDLAGAGAVIHALAGSKSPEAMAAEAVFLAARGDMAAFLRGSVSGRELIEKGYPEDVEIAAELGVSLGAARLVEGAFRSPGSTREA